MLMNGMNDVGVERGVFINVGLCFSNLCVDIAPDKHPRTL